MHRERLRRHVALGIDVAVEFAPGRDVVHQLDAGDLDDAMAVIRVEPGGFGIDHDLAHRLPSPDAGRRPCSRRRDRCRSSLTIACKRRNVAALPERRSARRNRRAAASRDPASAAAGSRRSAARSCPGRRITRSRCSQRRRRHDEHVIAAPLAAGLEQQRDVEHHERLAPRPARRRRSAARPRAPADAGSLRAAATPPASPKTRRPSAARSMPPASLRTPGNAASTAAHRAAARRQQPMDRGVGIEQRHAEPPQHRRGGALAHADRAGQAENDHAPVPRQGRQHRGAQLAGHPHRGAEPGLEPGPALMQQHAEPVDDCGGRAAAPPPAAPFRAAHRRYRRRPLRAAMRARSISSAGSPVMPRLVVLTSRPAPSSSRVALVPG